MKLLIASRVFVGATILVSASAKLGTSAEWDDRADPDFARELKGSGKSKDSDCFSRPIPGPEADALAAKVCPSPDGLLYPTKTVGSVEGQLGPTAQTPLLLFAANNCLATCSGGNYDACTQCFLSYVASQPCSNGIADLGACEFFGIQDARCPELPFLAYECCLTDESMVSVPFWYNSDSLGEFKFTECSDEIATRGQGSFQGSIPLALPTAHTTLEYWGTSLDTYNAPTTEFEYVQFDFMVKPGTCPDCTATSCGVKGNRVSFSLFTRDSPTSTSLFDCQFVYAPRVCPEGEWTTFRATFNGASASAPLATFGSCAADAAPYDLTTSVLGRNFFGYGSQPNAFGLDLIYQINVGDVTNIANNGGLEVYIDNIQHVINSGGKPAPVDIFDLEPDSCGSKSKSKSSKSKM